MPSPTASISRDAASPPLAAALGISGTAALLFIALLWGILCRHLSNEWAVNEQYSYGWFVPFFAAYLFWLRWETRPLWKVEIRRAEVENLSAAVLRSHFLLSTFYFLLLAALLPLRVFEIGNPDWRPLGWVHATVVIALTLLLLWRIGGPSWLRHFAFPVAFIFVAVPWVTPIEEPIVQGLMRVVTAIACETVNLLGIPAQLEGNVIRISSGVVGVNEACSGVRSLQTSIMVGLLFGELKRLSLVRRIALLAGAMAIAFIANCGRTLFLVGVAATRSIDAVSQWHDIAGYAILVVVFAGTMGIAVLLVRPEVENPKPRFGDPTGKSAIKDLQPDLPPPSFNFKFPTSVLCTFLAWLLLVEVAATGWFRLHERNLAFHPRWSVQWPTGENDYRESPINSETKNMLRYDEGKQVSWTPDRQGSRAFLFFFRWHPGGATEIRARSHRPDVCLPSIGWRKISDHGVRTYALKDGLGLPFRHFTFQRGGGRDRAMYAETFFCIREDRLRPRDASFEFMRAETPVSDWSRAERIRVVREGLRNTGQQVMQLALLSTDGVTPADAEKQFADLLPDLIEVESPAQ